MIDEHGRPGHTHRLPRSLLLMLLIICVGLVASIVLVSTLAHRAQQQAAVTDQRLRALEDFVTERGEMRDEQYTTLDSRITKALCDVLDGLPAGGLLDPIRAEYGCGPGVPLDQLPPAAQQQLQQFSTGVIAPPKPTPAVKPSQPAPETTNAPAPTPTVVPVPVAPVPATPTTAAPPRPGTNGPSVPPRPGTAPPSVPQPAARPTAPPLVDLTPITEPLCTGLGLCA